MGRAFLPLPADLLGLRSRSAREARRLARRPAGDSPYRKMRSMGRLGLRSGPRSFRDAEFPIAPPSGAGTGRSGLNGRRREAWTSRRCPDFSARVASWSFSLRTKPHHAANRETLVAGILSQIIAETESEHKWRDDRRGIGRGTAIRKAFEVRPTQPEPGEQTSMRIDGARIGCEAEALPRDFAALSGIGSHLREANSPKAGKERQAASCLRNTAALDHESGRKQPKRSPRPGDEMRHQDDERIGNLSARSKGRSSMIPRHRGASIRRFPRLPARREFRYA